MLIRCGIVNVKRGRRQWTATRHRMSLRLLTLREVKPTALIACHFRLYAPDKCSGAGQKRNYEFMWLINVTMRSSCAHVLFETY